MKTHSEQEMIDYGKKIAERLPSPAVVELIGDVGVGKTTLTKGLAIGYGILDEVTSPSFTIQKTYASKTASRQMTHFDFYRLEDPGIMQEELLESTATPNNLTVVEWAESVSNLLPKNTMKIMITIDDDASRNVEIQ